MVKRKLTEKSIKKLRPDITEAGFSKLIPFIVDGILPINHMGNFPHLLYNLAKKQLPLNYKYESVIIEGAKKFNFDINSFVEKNFNTNGKLRNMFRPDSELFKFYKFLHENGKIPYVSLWTENC